MHPPVRATRTGYLHRTCRATRPPPPRPRSDPGAPHPRTPLQADILPRNASNAGMAIIGMAASASGIIAPVVIGALRSAYGGFTVPLFFLAASTLLATVCLVPLGVTHRRRVRLDPEQLELV